MTERHASRRIVLRNDIPDAQIWDFAERQGWSYLGHVPRDPERGVFYEARWETSQGNTVHFIIDEFADSLYMVAQHQSEAEADRIADTIQDSLPSYSVPQLAEEFDINMYPAGWAAWLLRLGVGAPKRPDDTVTSRIRDSIGHKKPAVRRAAVWAIRYTAWPELKSYLEHMRSDEQDPAVLAEIEEAIRVFNEVGDSQ
ncbi:HEAT repeat domain-containing protein [Streptomyces sp. NPDC007991]|uniref:HEAT repeat domain-containing protein n=1 Tax=Streptomyces sp. NPDC007991 TaxID=3364803 RepID=UPI0036ED3CCB